MGHDLHPDPELGQARRLRASGVQGGLIEEMASAWVQQPMSRIEIRGSFRVSRGSPALLIVAEAVA
jgi:hypothetical protein